MTERKTGLTDAQLRFFLFRIKEILSLVDEAALVEADNVLLEFSELVQSTESDDSENEDDEYYDDEEWEAREANWKLERAEEGLSSFEKKLEEIDRRIQERESLSVWEYEELSDEAKHLEEYWPKDFTDKHKENIARLKSEGMRLAKLVKFTAHYQIVEESQKANYQSITSAQSVVRQLNEAFNYFKKEKLLTDEIKSDICKGKERAAWYRARKKLSEAEVSEAGGNFARATKLRSEANVLLSQDWSTIFPGESAPKIEAK